MFTYSITLSEAEDKALSYAAMSQGEWVTNAVKARCKHAMDEIVKLEVDRCLSDGTAIPSTRDAIVLQAFQRGTVCAACDAPPPATTAL